MKGDSFEYGKNHSITESFDKRRGFQPKIPPTKNQPFHPDSREIQVP